MKLSEEIQFIPLYILLFSMILAYIAAIPDSIEAFVELIGLIAKEWGDFLL